MFEKAEINMIQESMSSEWDREMIKSPHENPKASTPTAFFAAFKQN